MPSVKYCLQPFSLILILVSGCAPNADTIAYSEDPIVLNDPTSANTAPSLTLTSKKQIEYLRVKHHPVECSGFHVDHCLLTQKDSENQWVRFYDHIEGFTYYWGVDYEIMVEVQQIQTEMQDRSDRYYSLIKILSETKQDAFTYTSLEPHERIIEERPDYFSLLGKKDFTCTNNSCADIRSVIAQEHNALLLFRPETDPTKPLILDAVLCSDAAVSFEESCSQTSN